jgi:hypothetical protein
MKAFLVAYDLRELHKKSELKIVNMDMSAIQIGSLEILGIKGQFIPRNVRFF